MMTKRLFFLAVSFVALAAMAVPSAHAIPMLRLSDGFTVVTYTDQDFFNPFPFGDFDLNPGVVVSGLGDFFPFTGWTTFGSIGTTKPAIGNAVDAQMVLGSIGVMGGFGTTLTIDFTETDFGPLPSDWLFRSGVFGASFFGLPGDTLTYSAWLDPGNAPFGQTTLLTNQVFSLDDSLFLGVDLLGFAYSPVVPGPFPYSLTQSVQIMHSGFGITDFEVTLQAVPEPSSLLLLSSGIAAIGVLRLRRKTTNA